MSARKHEAFRVEDLEQGQVVIVGERIGGFGEQLCCERRPLRHGFLARRAEVALHHRQEARIAAQA